MTSDVNRPTKSQILKRIMRGRNYWNSWNARIAQEYPDFTIDLSEVEMPQTNLSEYDFSGINFKDANFEGLTLRKTNFSKCNLEGAKFTGSKIEETDFTDAILENADLRDVRLQKGIFTNAIMQGAKVWGYQSLASLSKNQRQSLNNLSDTTSNRSSRKQLAEIIRSQSKISMSDVERNELLSILQTDAEKNLALPRGDDNPFSNDKPETGEQNSDLPNSESAKSLFSNLTLKKEYQRATEHITSLLDAAKKQVEEVQHARENLLIASSEAAKEFERTQQSKIELEEIQTHYERLEKQILEISETTETSNDLLKQTKAHEQNIKSFLSHKKEEAIGDFRETILPELEAAKAEVKVDGIIGTAYQAWAKKQRNHWIAFGVGTFIFATSIIGLLIVAVLYQADILGFVKSMSIIETLDKDGNATSMTSLFGRLAAISIPVAAIAWILRLISRFTLQNLSLANDAGQRKVSIDTYSKLVGTEGALDDKDRTIMLNAIFRPLPGTAEPDINPPNLLDFVGKKGS